MPIPSDGLGEAINALTQRGARTGLHDHGFAR